MPPSPLSVSMFLFTTPVTAATAPATAPAAVPHANALKRAADATGVSFGFLAETARRESGFKENARAATSSARGLYQFIDQTWLRMMRLEGANVGQAAAAAAIDITASGKAVVGDSATRQQILALRDDPVISAQFAARLAKDNAASLTAALGRAPSDGELYIAHFLGPQGAARLIQLAQTQPTSAAASVFPAAAQANPAVFHDRSGEPLSASNVVARLTRGFGTGSAMADASGKESELAGSANRPLFHGLFSARTRAAASPSVASFWQPSRADAGMPLNINPFSSVRSTGA